MKRRKRTVKTRKSRQDHKLVPCNSVGWGVNLKLLRLATSSSEGNVCRNMMAGWPRNRTGTGLRNRRNRFPRNRTRHRNRRNRFPRTETGTGTVLSVKLCWNTEKPYSRLIAEELPEPKTGTPPPPPLHLNRTEPGPPCDGYNKVPPQWHLSCSSLHVWATSMSHMPFHLTPWPIRDHHNC